MSQYLKYFILIFSLSLINVSCDSSKSKKPKIFESPDGGKTIFHRDFGSAPLSRTTYENVYGYHPQELLIKKILPIDVFYKLFRSEKV